MSTLLNIFGDAILFAHKNTRTIEHNSAEAIKKSGMDIKITNLFYSTKDTLTNFASSTIDSTINGLIWLHGHTATYQDIKDTANMG